MNAALRASLVLAAGFAAILGTAQAQDASALRARSLAATCAACHGTDGRSARSAEPAGRAAAVPALAGMPADTLVARMNAFKSGARSGTVMPQIAKGFNDAQIAQLAAWFASARSP